MSTPISDRTRSRSASRAAGQQQQQRLQSPATRPAPLTGTQSQPQVFHTPQPRMAAPAQATPPLLVPVPITAVATSTFAAPPMAATAQAAHTLAVPAQAAPPLAVTAQPTAPLAPLAAPAYAAPAPAAPVLAVLPPTISYPEFEDKLDQHIDTFFNEMENALLVNRVDSYFWLPMLKGRMKGAEVQARLAQLTTEENTNYQLFKEAMRKHFMSPQRVDRAFQRMIEIKQGQKETSDQYAERLIRHSLVALRNHTATQRDLTLKQHFQMGLRQEIQAQVAISRPLTFDDARAAALTAEAYTSAGVAQRQAEAVASDNVSDVGTQLINLMKNLVTPDKRHPRVNQVEVSSAPNNQKPLIMQPPQRYNNRGRPYCDICHKHGHATRNCNYLPRQKRCDYCGRNNHEYEECRIRMRDQEQRFHGPRIDDHGRDNRRPRDDYQADRRQTHRTGGAQNGHTSPRRYDNNQPPLFKPAERYFPKATNAGNKGHEKESNAINAEGTGQNYLSPLASIPWSVKEEAPLCSVVVRTEKTQSNNAEHDEPLGPMPWDSTEDDNVVETLDDNILQQETEIGVNVQKGNANGLLCPDTTEVCTYHIEEPTDLLTQFGKNVKHAVELLAEASRMIEEVLPPTTEAQAPSTTEPIADEEQETDLISRITNKTVKTIKLLEEASCLISEVVPPTVELQAPGRSDQPSSKELVNKYECIVTEQTKNKSFDSYSGTQRTAEASAKFTTVPPHLLGDLINNSARVETNSFGPERAGQDDGKAVLDETKTWPDPGPALFRRALSVRLPKPIAPPRLTSREAHNKKIDTLSVLQTTPSLNTNVLTPKANTLCEWKPINPTPTPLYSFYLPSYSPISERSSPEPEAEGDKELPTMHPSSRPETKNLQATTDSTATKSVTSSRTKWSDQVCKELKHMYLDEEDRSAKAVTESKETVANAAAPESQHPATESANSHAVVRKEKQECDIPSRDSSPSPERRSHEISNDFVWTRWEPRRIERQRNHERNRPRTSNQYNHYQTRGPSYRRNVYSPVSSPRREHIVPVQEHRTFRNRPYNRFERNRPYGTPYNQAYFRLPQGYLNNDPAPITQPYYYGNAPTQYYPPHVRPQGIPFRVMEISTRQGRSASASTGSDVGVVTSELLVASLQAVQTNIQFSFIHAFQSACRSATNAFAILKSALLNNPTLAMRELLNRSDIISRSGGRAIEIWPCQELRNEEFTILPMNNTCYREIPIELNRPDYVAHKTNFRSVVYLDPMTNVIQREPGIPIDCNLAKDLPLQLKNQTMFYHPESGTLEPVLTDSILTLITWNANALLGSPIIFHPVIMFDLDEIQAHVSLNDIMGNFLIKLFCWFVFHTIIWRHNTVEPV